MRLITSKLYRHLPPWTHPPLYSFLPGSGNTVNVYVGTQNSTEEAVSWSPAVVFNPDTQSKVSVRKSGKLYGVKFESTGDFNWRLDGYEIELEDAGRRGSRMSA